MMTTPPDDTQPAAGAGGPMLMEIKQEVAAGDPMAQLDTTQLEEGEYVIIRQTHNTITLFNKHTGQTFDMPTSSVMDNQNEVEVVAMAPVAEEMVAMDEEGGMVLGEGTVEVNMINIDEAVAQGQVQVVEEALLT